MHISKSGLLLRDSTALTRPFVAKGYTRDAAMTFDAATIDSTGVFLIGELERLDQTLHQPLVNITWGRDIDLREDVTIADEASSFTNSSFASVGGLRPGGKSWVSKSSNTTQRIQLDIGKTLYPLYLWAEEVGWTLPELQSAQQAGRPLDAQMYEALKLKHQMDTDEMVYIGDTDYARYGLCNQPNTVVVPTNVPNGALGSPLWTQKTPDEILADINGLLSAVWIASALAQAPTNMRLPPTKFAYIATQKVSQAGNETILSYVKSRCISNEVNGAPLDIQPLKWLTGRGAAGVDRMLAYTRNQNYVRYPMVPLQHTPVEYRSLWQITTYYGRLGVLEVVYKETIGYADGL